MIDRKIAHLVLDDGRIFEGQAWAKEGEAYGEAVFATGMTGYQETLTDPSYCGQVVVMTAPHIGNTGMNSLDEESRQIWVSGFVVRDPSRISSNWRAERDLESDLISQGVVGICGIDTRALTRHLRDCGAMRVGIFSGEELPREEMIRRVRKSPQMAGSSFVAEVSIPEKYLVPATGKRIATVVALDLGIKGATPRMMSERGIEVHVFPHDTALEELLAVNPDGVFLSNGPGDPSTMRDTVHLVREVLQREIPVFGICFGHQIFGQALGFETYKLRFGHRGINQPVLDKATGKVEITAHNHGFAVQAPIEGIFDTVFGRGRVSHINLNDNVVEGLELLGRPGFSVQYHPEAAAGPHDAGYLFDRFIDLMKGKR